MEGTLIQGIGNEVLLYCAFFFSFIAVAIAYAYSRNLNNTPHESDNLAEQAHTARTYNNEICPICLSDHRLPVETNCGHTFCGLCIKSYISNRGGDFFVGRKVTCPLCRQDINLLLISFLRDVTSDGADRREVETCVHEFNVRFGNGPRNFMSYVRDCPILVRHLVSNFFCYEGIVLFFRLRVLCCFLFAVMYLIVPLDIIPEAMFGFFGLLDDVFIVLLCAIYISIIYRRFLVNRVNDVLL